MTSVLRVRFGRSRKRRTSSLMLSFLVSQVGEEDAVKVMSTNQICPYFLSVRSCNVDSTHDLNSNIRVAFRIAVHRIDNSQISWLLFRRYWNSASHCFVEFWYPSSSPLFYKKNRIINSATQFRGRGGKCRLSVDAASVLLSQTSGVSSFFYASFFPCSSSHVAASLLRCSRISMNVRLSFVFSKKKLD